MQHMFRVIAIVLMTGILVSAEEGKQAKKTYEKAKAAGKKTALLEQERPNIFTTSVANFLPDETVSVSFTYMEPIKYEDGCYNINFPMVVGQRYIPWKLTRDEDSNATITTSVKDADRLNPPVLHPNIDPVHRLSIAERIARMRQADLLVLMTCYPFRFIGPAPKRVLVWAKPCYKP